MRNATLTFTLLAILGLPQSAWPQPPAGEDVAPARRERAEGRRPPRGEGMPRESANREGRVLREFVKLRLMLRRLRQQESQLERGRQALADGSGKVEGGPVVTEREIAIRSELLEIERGRFVDAARRIATLALTKLAESQARKPESAGAAEPDALPPRIEEFRAACERIASADSTFESITAELDALAESARTEVPDAVLQQRLARLEGEADSLRERLRSIEEEIMMIRGDALGDFWGPGPGQGPPPGMESFPPPHEMRERGLFDGRTLPPNHPAMRRREVGRPEQQPAEKP